MKHPITWVVIADGAQATVFEHRGPHKGLRAVDGLHFEQEHLQAKDIMSDKPGRSIASTGGGARSGVEYSSDPVAVRERRFVENLAVELDKRHQAGEFERLVIAAAPTALGDLRPALSKGVRDTVLQELPKDLTNLPKAQLDGYFAELLPI